MKPCFVLRPEHPRSTTLVVLNSRGQRQDTLIRKAGHDRSASERFSIGALVAWEKNTFCPDCKKMKIVCRCGENIPSHFRSRPCGNSVEFECLHCESTFEPETTLRELEQHLNYCEKI